MASITCGGIRCVWRSGVEVTGKLWKEIRKYYEIWNFFWIFVFCESLISFLKWVKVLMIYYIVIK